MRESRGSQVLQHINGSGGLSQEHFRISIYKSKEWLQVQLVNNLLTPSEIGLLCNVSRYTIYRWMKCFGLKRRCKYKGREREWYQERYLRQKEERKQYAKDNFNIKRNCIRRAEGYWRYSGGRVVHRVIVEKVLGRPLKKEEQIHHIDGNGFNNHHKNLLVCLASYHRWLENKMARLYKREHFQGVCGKSVR